MKLTTVEHFIHFPDRLEDFNKKITCDKVDNLVVAATLLKSIDDIKDIGAYEFKKKNLLMM